MRAFLSLLAIMLAAPAFAADPFFKPKDRVVFLGDSITEQYQYSTYIELYLTTRFPDAGYFCLNAGIGGDRAVGGAGRFKSHVLDESPTAVTINFGMNDAEYGVFKPNVQKVYLEKTEEMLKAAKAAGVRVALMSPNAVDRRKNPNFKLYVETQKQFYAPLKDLAAKYGAAYVDQYGATRAALEKMEADKADSVIPYYDGFHTSPPGGLLMAHAILTGLGSPAVVSSAAITVGDQPQVKATGCKIENVVAKANSVSFQRTDEALPMPVQKEWVTILPYVNNLKDLNDYSLTIGGLTAGQYAIKIDGVEVAKASADDLAKGINLGNVTTGPIHAQAQKVFEAIQAKNGVVHGRFRGVLMFNAPDWLSDVVKERKPAELKKRMEEIEKRQQEINTLAKPKPHQFEITKS